MRDRPELRGEVRRVARNADAVKKLGCLRALVRIAPSEQLDFAIDQLSQEELVAGAEAVFEANMTKEIKSKLKQMAADARGTELVIICEALRLVADDRDTLELARGLLKEIQDGQSDAQGHLAILNLLAHAAYFNQAPETVEVFRTYLNDNPSWALLVIQTVWMVPGDGAEALLGELLNDPGIGVNANVAQTILSERKELMSKPISVSPGWRRAS